MEELSREKFEKLKELPIFKGMVVTDSMTPLIKVGDMIMVDVGNRDLKRFDVVVFYSDGKLICHYLWAMNRFVTPILFQTRGLKFGAKDFPVSIDDFLGKVVSHKVSAKDKFFILLKAILRNR